MSDFNEALKHITNEMDEMRKRIDSLTPEERTALMPRLRALTLMANTLLEARRIQPRNEIIAAIEQ